MLPSHINFKTCYNKYTLENGVMPMRLGLSRAKSPDKFDYTLMGIIIIMMFTSLAAIYSTSGILGAAVSRGYLIQQIVWYVLGFIIIGILMYLGNDSLLQFAKIGYWILLAMLALLLVDRVFYTLTGGDLPFFHSANGATSWYQIPGIGTFQPSEFMKIALIIIVANIIDEHNKQKLTESYEKDFDLLIEIAKWSLPPVVMILLQPDTGVVIIMFIAIAAMVLCSGIKKEWIIILFSIVAVALALFFYLFFFHFDFLSDTIGGEGGYKLKRITSWLNPESDISNTGHQLYLSLLVIGSAGLNGHGIGANLVALPEAQTDLIFAVIGQTWGFVGTVGVVGLCLFLDLHICRIASLTKNMTEKYILTGFLGLLLYQQFQNIGMLIGLLPITGITLPLLSYGGSSMLSYMVALGIVMNTSRKAKKLSDYVYE